MVISAGSCRPGRPLPALPSVFRRTPQARRRAATDPKATGGDYFGPDGFLQMRGYPRRVAMVKLAQNPEDAVRLWEVSEKLTGVHFGLKP